MKKFLKLIDTGVEKTASVGLYVSVMGMILFSVLTIVFRWINFNVHWFDPLVRHLVFMAAFLGGVLATGRKTHIGIDILGKYLETKGLDGLKLWVSRIISLASASTLVWLIKSSYDFMKIELEYGKVEFLGLHSGILVGIIPLGFALIGYRFFYIFLSSFFKEEAA